MVSMHALKQSVVCLHNCVLKTKNNDPYVLSNIKKPNQPAMRWWAQYDLRSEFSSPCLIHKIKFCAILLFQLQADWCEWHMDTHTCMFPLACSADKAVVGMGSHLQWLAGVINDVALNFGDRHFWEPLFTLHWSIMGAFEGWSARDRGCPLSAVLKGVKPALD